MKAIAIVVAVIGVASAAHAQYVVTDPVTDVLNQEKHLEDIAKTGDYAKRNETPGSPKKGEFMDNKEGGKPFKGVAKEPDKRRK